MKTSSQNSGACVEAPAQHCEREREREGERRNAQHIEQSETRGSSDAASLTANDDHTVTEYRTVELKASADHVAESRRPQKMAVQYTFSEPVCPFLIRSKLLLRRVGVSIVVNYPSWSTRVSTANQRPRSSAILRSGVGGARGGFRGVVNCHKVALEEQRERADRRAAFSKRQW